MAFDANDENDVAFLNSEIEKATTGLKNKNSELLGKINAHKSELETLKKQFEGLDVEAVRALLSRTSTDEEAKLIAAGKFDEVVSRRTETMKKAHEKELEKLQGEMKTLEATVDRFRSRALSDILRDAALKGGAEPTAADDIILRGMQVFSVDGEGNAVAHRANGEQEYGKDGKPLTPEEWVAGLREKAPHLWPRASGGGSGGAGGGGGGKKKFADMTEAERVELYKTDPAEYRRLRGDNK